MATIPGWLLRQAGQDVQVEAYAGAGAHGRTYAARVTVRALVEAKRRLVRNAEGVEVVSETTLRMRLTETCPPESRVTLPDGRTTVVIMSAPIDGGSLPVPSHLEVALQ